MNLPLLVIVLLGAFAWLPFVVWLDMRMYKNRKLRPKLFGDVPDLPEKELKKTLMEANKVEVGMFLSGFFVAVALVMLGWL